MPTSTKQLKYSGVLEGFYGPRWTHADRLALVKQMPVWNMNVYIYSARNDPYHRGGWAIPYPRDEMIKFQELAECAAKNKVMFSMGISPGNDYDQSNPKHRRLMMKKLQQFINLGCQLFPIFYDGVSAPIDFNGASGVAHAEKQAAIINYFLDQLTKRVPRASVLFCPTQFYATEKSAYLSRLHERLDSRVEVICTSVDVPDPQSPPRTHCPLTWPMTFPNDGARRYVENFGRKPFFWDNFNCADFALNQLNWSPYQGRGDQLDEWCSGILLNPQHIALVNWPVFGTVGEYFSNPSRYNPRKAMDRSLDRCLGKAGGVIGRILSKWYTTEWSGYLSSDENLPALTKNGCGTKAQRQKFLKQVKRTVAPLLSLNDRFNATLMPPDWACHLAAYIRLLTTWAEAMNDVCDAALLKSPIAPEQAQTARKTLVDLHDANNRLPDSLIDYLEGMVEEVVTTAD